MYSGTQWICTLVVLAIIVNVHATNTTVVESPPRCDYARLKCAYRSGCGRGLQMYLASCARLIQGETTRCSEDCQHALIALASTVEGQDLMACECAKDDRLCITSKQRIEVCRSSVMLEMKKTRVSCRLATWICEADTLCGTALYYYHGFCKNMFVGKRCNHRCRNSIDILLRQESAQKLNTCICDGQEDYDCKAIHRNMDTLCFGRINHVYQGTHPTETNEVSGSRDRSTLFSRTNFILGLLLLLFMS